MLKYDVLLFFILIVYVAKVIDMLRHADGRATYIRLYGPGLVLGSYSLSSGHWRRYRASEQ